MKSANNSAPLFNAEAQRRGGAEFLFIHRFAQIATDCRMALQKR